MPIRPAVPSWSSTLKLPRSSFPHRPLPADKDRYLKSCTDDLYSWQSRERAAQKPFIIHDGPPYANGSLHIGHALNKVLKDVIGRVKVQEGRRVTYRPGWDCHGLPIEIKALERQRELSKDGEHTLDAVGVRRVARELANRTVEEQKAGFKEWAVMGDWDHAWKTMDKEFEIKQLRVFQEMAKKGLIFRRYKPVYWSPSSRTALAEAELEYKQDHVSRAAFVKFRVEGLEKLGLEGPIWAVVWTTTPWTLPANRAIAVHKELEYTIVRSGEDNLIVAKSRLEDVTKTLGQDQYQHVETYSFQGEELVGAQYTNTLRGKEAVPQPILHADFVSADSGTGMVHMAPGHGMDDYEVCTRLGIEAAAPVNDLGQFTSAALPDDPEALAGKEVFKDGNIAVLGILGEKVLKTHNYKHKYPYDWRTKLPVITRATEQWFADVGSVKEHALEALSDVKFIPETGRPRLESFVKSRSEWCISRQRAWGVPIPALYDENGVAVLTDESVAHIISVINERGIDAWWTDPAEDPAWIVPGLKGSYRRGKDTMDVWFDSGTSWTQTDQQADVYLEGSDQHRGWFQSSLLTHTSVSGREGAPFKTLITHGFTLDQQGKKMSKSIGNTIAPSQIMDGSLLKPYKARGSKVGVFQAFGADALRLWVASSDYTRDVVIGTPVLQFNQSVLLKYRMIIKMLLGSMHPDARKSSITKLDQMALTQLQDVMTEVNTAYQNYEFYKGVNAINRWITGDLSAFYLEAMKDRLYCGDGGGVLEEIFHGLLKMLAPITPNLVEEAWDYRDDWMKAEDQIHPSKRPLTEPVVDPARLQNQSHHFEHFPQSNLAQQNWDGIIRQDLPHLLAANTAIKVAQEQARAKKLIGASLEAAAHLIVPANVDVFKRYEDELASIFVVSSVELSPAPNDAEWSFKADFEVQGEKGSVVVVPAKDAKCPRCWRYLARDAESLCGRCEEVVNK